LAATAGWLVLTIVRFASAEASGVFSSMRAMWTPLSTVLVALLGFCPGSAGADERHLTRFDIPAQSLPDALTAYARQAGLQLFFPSASIAARQSPALRGTLDAKAALAKLIAGSRLEVVSDDGRTVILRLSPKPQVIAASAAPTAPPHEAIPSDAASPTEVVIVAASPRIGALKRESDTIVDGVTQLEIGRLPNLDTSDVLARLPAVRRNETQSGEDRYVSIRGMVNSSASQSIDGVLLTDYISNSRATSTELLPAFLFKTMVMTTTVTPDLDENSNSANTALTTISGLDGQGERHLDLRLYAGQVNRSGGDARSPKPLRLSATWQGALDDQGRAGLAIGLGAEQLGSRQDATSVTSLLPIGGDDVPYGALTRGETYSKTERHSAMVRFDARPSESLSLFAEYFFLEHRFQTDQYTAGVGVSAAAVTDQGRHTGRFDSGTVTYGFNENRPTVRDHIVQAGANLTMPNGDTLSSRIGYTSDRSTQWVIQTGGFEGSSSGLPAPVSYRISGDGVSLFAGSGPGVLAPGRFLLSGKVTLSQVISANGNFFGRVDYAHNDGGTGFGYKIGAQVKTLDRGNVQYGYARILPSGRSISLAEVTDGRAVFPLGPVPIDAGALLKLLERRGISSPDTNGLYAADPADGYGQDFHGAEQVEDLYGIMSYGTRDIHLSAGVRIAKTHRDLDQFEPSESGAWGPVRDEQSYVHILPSLYGAYDVSARLKLRGAFTQTLERPAILGSSRQIVTSYDTPVTRSIIYNDPDILPTRSTNFEASAEYYYGRSDAYISVDIFSKYLRDIAATTSTQSIGADGIRQVTTYTSNVTWVNGKKVYGRDRGLEFAVSDPVFSIWPTRWGNLGGNVTFAYVAYQVTALNGGAGVPPTDVRLIDVGPHAFFTVSAFYKLGRFAANLFVQAHSSIPIFSYQPSADRRTYYQPLVDFQAGYAVSRSVRMVVEGRNMLDQRIFDRLGSSRYIPAFMSRNNGRTLWVGAQVAWF